MSNIENAARLIDPHAWDFRLNMYPDPSRRKERQEASLRAAQALEDVGLFKDACTCGPWHPGTDGPVETCPQHGRPYSEWVERSDTLQARLDAVTENTRTEWGARWVDGGHVIPQRSKVNAEKWVREVEKSVGAPAEVVTREVTEWTVAP